MSVTPSTPYDPATYGTVPTAVYHSFFTPPTEDYSDDEAIATSAAFPGTHPREITQIYEESTAHIIDEAIATSKAFPGTHPRDITQIYEESTAHIIGGHYPVDDESSSGSIILIGVILATVLVFLCIALVLRYVLKHKGSYYTHENKDANWTDSEAAELRAGDSLEDDLDEDV